ncbi:MAG: hypothetical protein WCH01_10475 [Methylococcaceae bacterium]
MQPIIRTIVILVSPLLLPSCSNALYFYETDKISLLVEARPDSSQPVQGNLGLKQRVALVTPATKNVEGDALSSINSFRFKIEEEPGFNPVTIQSAFITGDAAYCLNQKQTEKAASIVAQSGELQIVTVAPELLQSRRAKAATFIKGLSSNELDTLATAMDKEPGANALSDILLAVGAANSNTSFEVINQKLEVLFGRSF